MRIALLPVVDEYAVGACCCLHAVAWKAPGAVSSKSPHFFTRPAVARRYQGHVSAALVLGGVDFRGPHLFTVSSWWRPAAWAVAAPWQQQHARVEAVCLP